MTCVFALTNLFESTFGFDLFISFLTQTEHELPIREQKKEIPPAVTKEGVLIACGNTAADHEASH